MCGMHTLGEHSQWLSHDDSRPTERVYSHKKQIRITEKNKKKYTNTNMQEIKPNKIRKVNVIYVVFLIITARCYAERGYEIACLLSVCLSVTFSYRDQVGILRK